MLKTPPLSAWACTLLCLGAQLFQPALAADGSDIGSYLADIGGGPIAAHEILGLPAGVVTQLQSPKDLVVALDMANDSSKNGFGIAISPARFGDNPMAVGIGAYSNSMISRLWGGTSFSYAQRTKDYDGTDYRENAVAMHVDYFLTAGDDPVIAARRSLFACKASAEKEAAFAAEAQRRAQELLATGRGSLADLDRLKDELRADDVYKNLEAAGAEARKCVRAAYDSAKAKWNSSQVGFTIGKGWIRGGELGRTSLAQHVALTVAYAPPRSTQSLLNLTYRHVAREVDTSTLAGVPVFHKSNLVAFRYTYGHGDEQDTFLLAEVSNAKSSKQTEANEAFKYAVGLDRKLADGLWLELRVGRSRSTDGTGLETKALMNLKLSPTPSLPKQLAAAAQ